MEVVVPQTKILGETDIFVKSGSTVQIKCIIMQSLEQPSYIFWYHDGGRLLNLNGKHQWVERVSAPLFLTAKSACFPQIIPFYHILIPQVNSDTTIGTLVIKMADRRDTGNYTCAPSNLDSASVILHVLNGS